MAVTRDVSRLGVAVATSLTYAQNSVSGTPNGIVVFVLTTSGMDVITTVTYGGVACTEIAGSPLLKATTETMGVHAFFLGQNVPTGAQNVVITATGTVVIVGISETVDSDIGADTFISAINTAISSDSVANPADTLALFNHVSLVVMGFMSGHDDAADCSPLTGWTSRHEGNAGTVTEGMYEYDTVAGADVGIGWTQTAEDAIAIAVGITDGAIVADTGILDGETVALAETIGQSDTVTLAETDPALAETLTATETGALAETSATTADLFTGTDTGTLADDIVELADADEDDADGTLADAVADLLESLALTESATIVESVAVAETMTATDTGTLADVMALLETVADTEGLTLSETLALLDAIAATDSGTLGESGDLLFAGIPRATASLISRLQAHAATLARLKAAASVSPRLTGDGDVLP
jgi:hypothetical protein